MTCNVGGVERPIRIVGGLLLIGVGVFADLPAMGMGIALTVGVVFLATAGIGYCPLTSLLGINTYQSSTSARK